jgi:hypothetical protein
MQRHSWQRQQPRPAWTVPQHRHPPSSTCPQLAKGGSFGPPYQWATPCLARHHNPSCPGAGSAKYARPAPLPPPPLPPQLRPYYGGSSCVIYACVDVMHRPAAASKTVAAAVAHIARPGMDAGWRFTLPPLPTCRHQPRQQAAAASMRMHVPPCASATLQGHKLRHHWCTAPAPGFALNTVAWCQGRTHATHP